MEDEVKNAEKEQMTADDYIESLAALKENTVSKDEYERVMADNKKLMNALANGYGKEQEETKEEAPDIDALRKRLFVDNKYKNDLEFFGDLLELRSALIDRGEPDPFLPSNPEYIPNQVDSDRAQFIADEIQAAMDYCEGDEKIFTVDLQRRCGIKSRR